MLFNTRKERTALWASLQATHRLHRKRYLSIGDFNSILQTEDRIGGNPVSLAEVVDFAKCVEECGLIELPHQGSQYTWE